MQTTAVTVLLENARVRAEIAPERGARLVSLRLDGLEVLGGADHGSEPDDSIGTGAYPMVPWAGRLAGERIHGRGRDTVWTDHGGGELSVELLDAAGEPGTATLGYLLLDDGLEISLAWHGTPDGWCTLGFHPWFRRQLDAGEPVVLSVDATEMVERGPDHLPTGSVAAPTPRPWDDCVRLAEPPSLTWPGALTLQLTTDADWWVIFDGSRDAVCVEPQTAPPDAIHHPALRPDHWPRRVDLVLRIAPTSDGVVDDLV